MVKKLTYEYVKDKFKERGYTLVDTVYQNSKTKMKYICPKHPDKIQEIRYNDLQGGHGCNFCKIDESIPRLREYSDRQRLPISEIEKEFKIRGYEIIRESYISASEPVEFICPKHPEKRTRMRIADLRRGCRCRYCSHESTRLSEKSIRDIVELEGLSFIGVIRNNKGLYVKYVCQKHPLIEQETYYNDLKNGRHCYYCGIEKISGANHYNYNSNKSPEERAFDRRYDEKERKWRNSVFERDRYRCTVCNASSGLNAHHKDGWNWCVERRYDVTNGVTLCKDCHVSFHSMFGFGNNTEEQFSEWVSIVTPL